MLKKCFFTLIVLFLFLSCTACTMFHSLPNNYYLGFTEKGSCCLYFQNDGTVQIVTGGRAGERENPTTCYAAYSLHGSTVTLHFGKDAYLGVVLKEGNAICFGETTFKKTAPEKISPKIMDALSQRMP